MDNLRSNPWATLAVLSAGFFLILLDTTIVNIAIPSIIDDLAASLDTILWVVNAYVLVFAVLLITAGRLGDIYGQRNMFALGIAIFVLASALSGLAQDTNQLIAGRVIQGLGGALLVPQTLAIITSIFPRQGRGAAFGVWGAVAGIAAVIGPTFGGVIVSNWTWRWVFYVNLPVGVLALAATFLIVPDLRPSREHRRDVSGVALATAGLFGVVFGLIEGERFDWGPIWGWLTVPAVIVIGLLLLTIFTIWEKSQEEPLVPLSLFRERNFAVMNWVAAAVAFSILGSLIPITIFLQSVLGMTAFEAGLTIAPTAVISMLIAPISGRLADRTGGKYIIIVGLLFFAAGLGLVGLVASPTATWSTFLPPLIVLGIGQGLVFPPLVTVAMRNIHPQQAGAASGVFNTTRQMGMVIGSAVIGAVLQNRLVAAIQERAVIDSAQLPAEIRQRFVDTVAASAKAGLEIGAGQAGLAALPPGVPPEMAEQLRALVHNVFANAFASAMRSALLVSAAVLLVGAISAVAIKGGRTRGETDGEAESGTAVPEF